FHEKHPYQFEAGGVRYRVSYEPAESQTALFGGNSNWRGPVWLPVNYLIIEALERYHHFYGDDLKVECPSGSGNLMTLGAVSQELARRLAAIFLPNSNGERPWHGDDLRWASDPNWRDLVLFHDYLEGETGKGLGASHQTGWTALVVRCAHDLARRRCKDGIGRASGPNSVQHCPYPACPVTQRSPSAIQKTHRRSPAGRDV